MAMGLSSGDSSASAYPFEVIYMDPAQLEQALTEVTAGRSIRSTAKQYHVSKDYLRRRIEGTITRREFNAERQALAPS